MSKKRPIEKLSFEQTMTNALAAIFEEKEKRKSNLAICDDAIKQIFKTLDSYYPYIRNHPGRMCFLLNKEIQDWTTR